MKLSCPSRTSGPKHAGFGEMLIRRSNFRGFAMTALAFSSQPRTIVRRRQDRVWLPCSGPPRPERDARKGPPRRSSGCVSSCRTKSAHRAGLCIRPFPLAFHGDSLISNQPSVRPRRGVGAIASYPGPHGGLTGWEIAFDRARRRSLPPERRDPGVRLLLGRQRQPRTSQSGRSSSRIPSSNMTAPLTSLSQRPWSSRSFRRPRVTTTSATSAASSNT